MRKTPKHAVQRTPEWSVPKWKQEAQAAAEKPTGHVPPGVHSVPIAFQAIFKDFDQQIHSCMVCFHDVAPRMWQVATPGQGRDRAFKYLCSAHFLQNRLFFCFFSSFFHVLILWSYFAKCRKQMKAGVNFVSFCTCLWSFSKLRTLKL